MAGVAVKGVDKLLAKLSDMEKRDVAGTAVKRACLIVEHEAKKNCPHGDGFLKSSITHSTTLNGDIAVGTVATNEEYAAYVEFGTGLYAEKGDGRKDVPWVYRDAAGNFYTTAGQHPQPFLRPALENSKEKIKSVFRRAIRDKVKEVCND